MEQAARVLGIGRQTAYAQCRLSLATDSREGIPCHRIGRLILVYRAELEAWLGFAIVWPPEVVEPAPAAASPPGTSPSTTTHSRATSRTRRVAPDQPTLPF